MIESGLKVHEIAKMLGSSRQTIHLKLMEPFEAQCHDCGAGSSNYHHPGCDVEECPKCRGQMIWCNCFEDIEFIAK